MSTESIKAPFSSTSPLSQRVQISKSQGDKTMQHSFNNLFGGQPRLDRLYDDPDKLHAARSGT